jgi:hypothetical protein
MENLARERIVASDVEYLKRRKAGQEGSWCLTTEMEITKKLWSLLLAKGPFVFNIN